MDSDIGFFERGIIKLFGRNYRTTVPGIVATICTPIVAADQFISHPVLHAAAAVCTVLGFGTIGAIGVGSKASNVTGAGQTTRVVKR